MRKILLHHIFLAKKSFSHFKLTSHLIRNSFETLQLIYDDAVTWSSVKLRAIDFFSSLDKSNQAMLR